MLLKMVVLVGYIELYFSIIAGFIQILLEARITVGFPNAYALHLAGYPIVIPDRHLLLLLLSLLLLLTSILFKALEGFVGHQRVGMVSPVHCSLTAFMAECCNFLGVSQLLQTVRSFVFGGLLVLLGSIVGGFLPWQG